MGGSHNRRIRRRGKTANQGNGSKIPRRSWVKKSNQRLLSQRMCDLELSIEGSAVEKFIQKVLQELSWRDILFKPYFWLSDDWFTPDGLTGVAIPFYLAHPRLRRLERSQMGELEGGSRAWCMKFLRHEVGHAMDHAYMFHRRRKWQKLFGLSSHRYPRFYRPNPYSRRHVQHLAYWYAQSHPDEDFAETFAVWLQPRSQWRKRYQGWHALRKLEYVEALMKEIAGQRPQVNTRVRVDTLPTLKKTLGQHYQMKREGVGGDYPESYDQDLLKLFVQVRGRKRRERASAFVRRMRPEILRLVSGFMGDRRYQLDLVLNEMIRRCRRLSLYVNGSERQTLIQFAILLTRHTMDSLYRHRSWVEL